jgi:putative glutamine amidotransferase
MDKLRDQVEFALLKAYLDAGKPVFGICRGLQLINIYFGGSLHQDIAEGSMHDNGKSYYITHRLTAEADSIVGAAYGTTLSVNSAHHQAIKRLGDGLRPTAFWEGKYIEAFEHVSLPLFAVQWHPERMCFGHAREDTVDGTALFEKFLQMCRK